MNHMRMNVMMLRAIDSAFHETLGHRATATTGLGSIAASRSTNHESTGMENPPSRFVEALKC